MKNLYITAVLIIFLSIPTTTQAAWYWLNNPADPDLGEFVSLSALEYAETTASKALLIPIDDELKELLDDAKYSDNCSEKYDSVISSLKMSLTTYEISDTFEQSISDCVAEEEELEDLEEALGECDLEYLDEELSGSEKVTYHKEIDRCEVKLQEEEDDSRAVIEIEKTRQQVQEVAPAVIPEPLPPLPNVNTTEVDSEAEIRKRDPVAQEEVHIQKNMQIESESQNTLETTNFAASTNDDTGTPTFIQKVFSFFSNLFSW